MKYEILDKIPISGELFEKHFGQTDPEALWIRFYDLETENWYGSFANGGLAFENRKIEDFSAFSKFAVLNNGAFYLIDPYSKEILFKPVESYFSDFVLIPENDLLFLATFWAVFVYKSNELIKLIKPDFIDGIKFTKRIDNLIIGEIYDPGEEGSKFELDINTLILKWDKFEY